MLASLLKSSRGRWSSEPTLFKYSLVPLLMLLLTFTEVTHAVRPEFPERQQNRD